MLACVFAPAATPTTAASSPSLAPTARSGAPGACHALLIGGMPGTPIHARQYRDWLKRFHTYLTQKAGVKLLVLTHIIPGNADKTIVERVSKKFSGKVVAGKDLMRF